MINIPFGRGNFRLYDGVKDFTCTKHTGFTPLDESASSLLISVFDGYTWARTAQDSHSWELAVHGISYTEYIDTLRYFEGKTAHFVPHVDRPDLDYEVIVTFVEHAYEKNNFFMDEAVLKIAEKDYK